MLLQWQNESVAPILLENQDCVITLRYWYEYTYITMKVKKQVRKWRGSCMWVSIFALANASKSAHHCKLFRKFAALPKSSPLRTIKRT